MITKNELELILFYAYLFKNKICNNNNNINNNKIDNLTMFISCNNK